MNAILDTIPNLNMEEPGVYDYVESQMLVTIPSIKKEPPMMNQFSQSSNSNNRTTYPSYSINNSSINNNNNSNNNFAKREAPYHNNNTNNHNNSVNSNSHNGNNANNLGNTNSRTLVSHKNNNVPTQLPKTRTTLTTKKRQPNKKKVPIKPAKNNDAKNTNNPTKPPKIENNTENNTNQQKNSGDVVDDHNHAANNSNSHDQGGGASTKSLDDADASCFAVRPYQWREAIDLSKASNVVHPDGSTSVETRAICLPAAFRAQVYMRHPFATTSGEEIKCLNGQQTGFCVNEIVNGVIPREDGQPNLEMLVINQYTPQSVVTGYKYTDKPWDAAVGCGHLPYGHNTYRLANSLGQQMEYHFYPKQAKNINDPAYVFHIACTSFHMKEKNPQNPEEKSDRFWENRSFLLGVEEVRKQWTPEQLASPHTPSYKHLPYFLLPELQIDMITKAISLSEVRYTTTATADTLPTATTSGGARRRNKTTENGVMTPEAPTHERVFNENELYVLTQWYLLSELLKEQKYPFDTLQSLLTCYAGFPIRKTEKPRNNSNENTEHNNININSDNNINSNTGNYDGNPENYYYDPTVSYNNINNDTNNNDSNNNDTNDAATADPNGGNEAENQLMVNKTQPLQAHLCLMFMNSTGISTTSMVYFHYMLPKSTLDINLAPVFQPHMLLSEKREQRDKMIRYWQKHNASKNTPGYDFEKEDQDYRHMIQAIEFINAQKEMVLANNPYTAGMTDEQLEPLFVNNFMEKHFFQWERFWDRADEKCPLQASKILSEIRGTRTPHVNKPKVPYFVFEQTWNEIEQIIADQEAGNYNENSRVDIPVSTSTTTRMVVKRKRRPNQRAARNRQQQQQQPEQQQEQEQEEQEQEQLQEQQFDGNNNNLYENEYQASLSSFHLGKKPRM